MNRRLGVSTAAAVILCLVLQHIFVNNGDWSLLAIMGKTLSIIGAMLIPSAAVSSYFYSDHILPVTVVCLALIIVWMILAGARKAMRQATPDAEAPIWELPDNVDHGSTGEPPAVARELSCARQLFRFNSLRGKLTLGFFAISLFIAIAAASFTFDYLHVAVERNAKARAAIAGTAVNAIAVWHVDAKRYQELRDELAKVTTRPAVAYAFVEDGDGKLIAHAPKNLPNELIQRPTLEPRLMTGEVSVSYRDEVVYDYAQRSNLNSRFVVHVGIWRDSVTAETWSFVAPILLAVVLLVLCATLVFIVMLQDLHRPLLELVEQSARISKGDFTATLATKRNDDLGELARSLERMRSSLRAVLARIGSEPAATASDRQRRSF